MTFSTRIATIAAPFCLIAYAQDPFSIDLTPDVQERCHIVRFPQGWAPAIVEGRAIENIHYNNDYEFRMIGESSSRFVVAAIVRPRYEETPPIYTPNKYLIDLSNRNAPVLEAGEKQWNSGVTVLQTRKRTLLFDAPDSSVVRINGHVLPKSGQHWTEDRLSPDGRWIVLQSWEGRSGGGGDWNIRFEWGMVLGYTGSAFWDVYQADTGRKMLTIKGRYDTSNAREHMLRSFWLAERYFIIPLGQQRQQCLVCEFGGKAKAKQ